MEILAELGNWSFYALGILALAIALAFVANAVAWKLDVSRRGRIQQYYEALSSPSHNAIPVTLLTGFLGSGKTTLVNRILTSDHGLRIVVVVNEFGEVAIDHLLLQENAKLTAGIVVMPNGCMCCARGQGSSGALELEEVLRNLLELSQQQAGLLFEYVLIETSGLADPGPLVAALSRLDVRFYLDGTVTLVDATNARRIIADENAQRFYPEAARQAVFADVIVLTKHERASSPDVVSEAIASLRAINASARIVCADDHFAGTDVLQLLHLQRSADFLPDCAATAAAPSARRCAPLPQGSRTGRGAHAHAPAVSSVSIQTGAGGAPAVGRCCASAESLERWITRLVQPHSAARATVAGDSSAPRHELWRVKGIFAVAGDPRQLLVHAVFGEVQVAAGSRWEADEPRCCRIVFIGLCLDAALLRSQFAELLTEVHGDYPAEAPEET
jgi:G3E family GTPase